MKGKTRKQRTSSFLEDLGKKGFCRTTTKINLEKIVFEQVEKVDLSNVVGLDSRLTDRKVLL